MGQKSNLPEELRFVQRMQSCRGIDIDERKNRNKVVRGRKIVGQIIRRIDARYLIRNEGKKVKRYDRYD